MITAVDTSVLLDVFTADPAHVHASQKALRKAIREGTLVICEVVLAELRPCFPKRAVLLGALRRLNVEYVPVSREASLLAGEAWKTYRESGGKREHLVPDFLVAAHAKTSAQRLLTRDRGFYRRWFRGLTIIGP